MTCKFGNTFGNFHNINVQEFGALANIVSCYANYLITLILSYKGIILYKTYFSSTQSYHVQLRS